MMRQLITVLAQTTDGVDSVGEAAAQNPLAALGGLLAAGALVLIITVVQIVLRLRQSEAAKTDDAPESD